MGAHIWQIEIFMSFSLTKCLVDDPPISRACREGLGSPGLGTHIWRLAPEGPLQSPGLGAREPPIYRSGWRTPRPGDVNVQNPPRPGDSSQISFGYLLIGTRVTSYLAPGIFGGGLVRLSNATAM